MMPYDYTGRHIEAVYFLSQFHMMARLDDVVKCEDIVVTLKYLYTLKSEMCAKVSIK